MEGRAMTPEYRPIRDRHGRGWRVFAQRFNERGWIMSGVTTRENAQAVCDVFNAGLLGEARKLQASLSVPYADRPA